MNALSDDDARRALMSATDSIVQSIPTEFEPSHRDVQPPSRWHAWRAKLQSFYHNYILANSGISLLILSQVLNSVMVTTCKLLLTDKSNPVRFDPLQVLFFRMIITYVCCLLYMYITKSVADAPFGPRDLRLYLACRGVFGFLGVYGLYFSLQYLSVLDAMAITFLIPMVTGLVAWIVLRERYSLLEAACTFTSLAGVLLIAKPNFLFGALANKGSDNELVESSSPRKRLLATAIGLAGVVGASLVYVILRIVKSAHPLISVSYFALTCVIITSVSITVTPGLVFVVPTTAYQWFLFLLIGLSGFFMQFSLAAGVQRVKASLASLITYTNIIFALIWDLIIWGHVPGLLSFIGIVIIITMAAIAVKYRSDIEKPLQLLRNTDLEGDPKGDSVELLDFEITDDHSESEQGLHERM